MIDTHLHLTDARLASQLDAAIGRATSAGVSKLISIGTDLEDSLATVELCRGRDNVRCAVGVHPNNVQNVRLEEVDMLRGLALGPSVVAIGECGLDYHYLPFDAKLQAAFFQKQLQIASDLNKPVVVHSRDACDDTLSIMKAFPAVRAVFHCFTGTLDEARHVLDAGYLLGFTGPITYKKNDALRDVVRLCPADRLLVETDAPYLSPEPARKQKICEPAFVMHTAAVVGVVRGLSLKQVDELTTTNALRFFAW